jgi:hypothetical protein
MDKKDTDQFVVVTIKTKGNSCSFTCQYLNRDYHPFRCNLYFSDLDEDDYDIVRCHDCYINSVYRQ